MAERWRLPGRQSLLLLASTTLTVTPPSAVLAAALAAHAVSVRGDVHKPCVLHLLCTVSVRRR
jgi:hypothetical protein